MQHSISMPHMVGTKLAIIPYSAKASVFPIERLQVGKEQGDGDNERETGSDRLLPRKAKRIPSKVAVNEECR
jgi:hypothetical protein